MRQSTLADAPADLIVFGMGEQPAKEVARRLDAGEAISEIRDVLGTAVKEEVRRWLDAAREDAVVIPGFNEVKADKRKYSEAFASHYKEQDPFLGRSVVQPHPKTVIIQNPPARPLTADELDHIYELPFTRLAHPSYQEQVPALEPCASPSPATGAALAPVPSAP